MLEQKRNWLIEQLSLYHKLKGYPVTVVFDGWRSGSVNETEEKKNGLTIVYSQRGERADSVIIRRAHRRGSGVVVVSSDREIRNAVQRFGAVAVYAGEFMKMLRNLDMVGTKEESENPKAEVSKKGNPRRLSKNERKRREKLKKLKP